MDTTSDPEASSLTIRQRLTYKGRSGNYLVRVGEMQSIYTEYRPFVLGIHSFDEDREAENEDDLTKTFPYSELDSQAILLLKAMRFRIQHAVNTLSNALPGKGLEPSRFLDALVRRRWIERIEEGRTSQTA